MNPKRKKLKCGQISWEFRFTSPFTKKRTHFVSNCYEKRDAEADFKRHLETLRNRKIGLPDNSGWEMSYTELVKRFLAESALSELRQSRLSVFFEENPLRLRIGAELANKGPLTERCKALIAKRGDVFVIKCVQQPLKQLCSWAASVGVFPYDPLASWKKFQRVSHAKQPRAFSPAEVRAILDAAAELDRSEYRAHSSALVFKTVLIAGNRPGAVFAATVADLEENRLRMPPGRGKKFNGCCMLPPELVEELKSALELRGTIPASAPLLVTGNGCKIDARNIQDTFKRAVVLACVKLNWPAVVELGVTPRLVALAIHKGKVGGFDGVPPVDEEKKQDRERIAKGISALAIALKPRVVAFLKDRLLRELRHTHITWARACGVNRDFVEAQVGHRGGSVQNRHYQDQSFQDAMQSARAVWDVLKGEKTLQMPGFSNLLDLKTDLKAKNDSEARKSASSKIVQVVGGDGVETGSPTWIRTRNPVINSLKSENNHHEKIIVKPRQDNDLNDSVSETRSDTKSQVSTHEWPLFGPRVLGAELDQKFSLLQKRWDCLSTIQKLEILIVADVVELKERKM